MKLLRVQRSRRPGSKLPPGAIVVTRPTRWGNPFPALNGDKARAVAMYRDWLANTPEGRKIAEDAKRELRGKVLACWCGADEVDCHASVLVQISNETDCPRCEGTRIYNFSRCAICNGTGKLDAIGEGQSNE